MNAAPEWSDKDRLEVSAMFEGGASRPEIARYFGVSENAITGILHRARDPRGKTGPGRVRGVKTRQCLMCRHGFASRHVGERVCKPCKASGAWTSSSGLDMRVVGEAGG